MGSSPDDVEEDTWPDPQREERPVPLERTARSAQLWVLASHPTTRPEEILPGLWVQRGPRPTAQGGGTSRTPLSACLSVLPSRQECKSARPGSLYVASTSPRRAWPCTPTGGPTGQDSLGNERRAHHSLPWISPVTLIKAEKDTGAPRVCECSGWGEDAQELGSQLAGLASEVQHSQRHGPALPLCFRIMFYNFTYHYHEFQRLELFSSDTVTEI